MRKTILGLLVIVLAFIAPTIWERIMNQAPEWAWRGVFALFIVGGTAFVLLSDPVYLRIRVPFEYPFVSTAIIATAAAVCFGGLWYLVVMPTMQACQIADTTSAQEAAIDVNAYLPPVAPYPEGFAFGGIIWNNHYVDGRLDMSTKAGAVRKLDVVVGLDTHIAGIGQITQFPNVTMFPDQMPLMWLRGTDLQGHPISIPATPMLGIAPVYRIQCDQIFANTTVHFVIASVAMNPMPQQMFAPRRNPKKIRLNGTYQTEQGVKRKIDYTFDFPDVAPKQ